MSGPASYGIGVILQRCQRTGALVEDCGGNFACDNSCLSEDVEFVAIEHVLDDEAVQRALLAAQEQWGWNDLDCLHGVEEMRAVLRAAVGVDA